MKKVKKMAIGGGSSLSSVLGLTRGSQSAPPNLKNNRLTSAQITPGSPSGGQMSMPTQPYSGQMNMPKNGILNNISGGAFNKGTQRPPQSGIPTQMPAGQGLGSGMAPQSQMLQQSPNAAAMAAKASNSATMTPTGPVSGGMAAGPIGKNAPTGKTFNFGSIGMSGPSIAQQTSGYKKGGVIPASKISTATKNKKNPNW